MKITVKFFTAIREITSKGEEQIELSRVITVKELLDFLSKKYGRPFTDYVYDEKESVRSYIRFVVNGRSITTLQGLKTELKEGDKVAIIPPVGGG